MDELFVASFVVTAALLSAVAVGRPRRPSRRSAADSTSVNPEQREPIDARMPQMPPA